MTALKKPIETYFNRFFWSNECPSPDGNGILLCQGLAQKIQWTAGNSS
jgi:hypothetical protein